MKKGFLPLICLLFSSSIYADICGPQDDRAFSTDPRVGKITKYNSPGGCTISLIGKNCALTAGHCSGLQVAHFNVPKSINGVPQEARLEDQYEVENGQFNLAGVGADWGVVKLRPNTITGKNAHDVQGMFKYNLKARKKMNIKIISYGYVDNNSYPVKSGEVPPSPIADILNHTQQISYGQILNRPGGINLSRIAYDADTGSGSAGAAIIDVETDNLIGINTHGGCRMGDRTNAGTMISNNKKLKEAIAYCFER